MTDDEPDAPGPHASEPHASEPQASEPQASETHASETHASETHASETHASETQASDPQASDPQASETHASEPQASEPQASEHRASEPRASEPHASEPQASQPPASLPYAPEPGISEPLEPDLWDRGAAWLMQHGALPALGLLTLGMMLIYAHMFRGELAGDDLTFHMAESARLADCLRAGDFDFWNPSANGGFASAYYYQVVPQLASAIPAAVFGHHVFFFELSVFLPLVLAPAAAYRGMRLIGATPWQAALAALAIGFLNGESRWGTGNAGTFNVGLYTQTWALAAFPLALGHAVRWATDAKGLAPAIAWGAFVTLCHPFAGVALAVALVAGVTAQLVLAAVDQLFDAIGQGLDGDPDRDVISAVREALGKRWRNPPPRPWLGELVRLAILGVCLGITWTPIWLPLVIDYDGFGGFPHRVNDEVGPGFKVLLKWFTDGAILDHARPSVLTGSLPLIALFARARFLRWLWAPAVVYAAWLGLGPHLGKTDDDLIPAVRFLGAMQIVMALAIGAGAVMLGKRVWNAGEGSYLSRGGRLLIMIAGLGVVGAIAYMIWKAPAGSSWLVLLQQVSLDRLSIVEARVLVIAGLAAIAGFAASPVWRALASQYGVRTGLAAAAAALGVLLTLPGAQALASRVRVLPDFEGSHGDELHDLAQRLQREPPGRKQVGPGAENHWWNLLTYEYGRRPSLLMMGGGGLQASPNYDFLWTVKDFAKNAWVYDAPLLVFQKTSAAAMPIGDEILETKHYQARRLPSPGLVSPVQITGTLPPGRKPARAAAIAWFKTDLPLKDHVLAYAGSGGPGGEPHGTVTRAFRQSSPGDAADIYAEVDVTEPTTFLARESWHPRWHAYVDRIEVPVRRVTPDFPAVDVPPGHHVIALRFERPWWAQAAWLTWPLLPLVAWFVTRPHRRRRIARAA
jgi:hypothetical protein